MAMKNRREAIIEFLRLDLSEKLFEDHLGHVIQQEQDQSKTGREIKPIDQIDVFKWHCQMLEKFADQEDKVKSDEQIEKKKTAREKRAEKALKMLANKTQEMYQDLKQMK